jgi:hypothetical protein
LYANFEYRYTEQKNAHSRSYLAAAACVDLAWTRATWSIRPSCWPDSPNNPHRRSKKRVGGIKIQSKILFGGFSEVLRDLKILKSGLKSDWSSAVAISG